MIEREVPSRLEDIQLGTRAFWSSPPGRREGALEWLRREHPVSFHAEPAEDGMPAGPGFWSLTRHAQISEVSGASSLWSSSPTAMIRDFPPRLEPFFRSMVNMDDPRHTRLRKIVSRGFTPRALAEVTPAVERRATSLIDAVLDKGECDFVLDLAAPFPLLVICDMMGIPESHAPFVFEQTNIVMSGAIPPGTPPLADRVELQASALEALTEFMLDLGRSRRARPRRDLTSTLIHADVDGEALNGQELASFFILLILAGSETTRQALAHGVEALCRHPDQRRAWWADFETRAPAAIEEVLRWSSPVRSFRRRATRDTQLCGQRIREGEKVVLWYGSANRDSAVFDAPYEFDLTRSPNEHLAFGGYGAHYCLGASLARRELFVMFRELSRRLPEIELSAAPKRLQTSFMDGILSMPCTFAREAT